MALIGYARVSTQDQNVHLQKDALTKVGCEKIFTDTISGSTTERRGLDEALNFLRNGDILVVWKLDRLGRTMKHLIETVTMLKDKGIGFKCLTENLDTTTSDGKLIFHFFGSLAEFERDLIRERTKAGLAAARARGRTGGRPQSPFADEKKLEMAKKMYMDKTIPVKDILLTFGIKKTTFYKYLKIKKTKKSNIPNEKKTLADVRHQEKTIKLTLYLPVENNSKFVRGKGKVRSEIEEWVLPEYHMEKSRTRDWEYILTIQYTDDEDLDKTIEDIIYEMNSIADRKNCFIEPDFYTLDGEHSYPFAGYK
jgi:DNA invertase Pin-like site-specific DNA recombinase